METQIQKWAQVGKYNFKLLAFKTEWKCNAHSAAPNPSQTWQAAQPHMATPSVARCFNTYSREVGLWRQGGWGGWGGGGGIGGWGLYVLFVLYIF